jgi:hypothetical protein
MTTLQTKDYHFSAEALKNLLTHYFDGEVPMSGEVMFIGQHPQMVRKIGLMIDSPEWEISDPLFLSYDGKRVRSWYKGQDGEKWEQRAETPTRQ